MQDTLEGSSFLPDNPVKGIEETALGSHSQNAAPPVCPNLSVFC